MRKKTAPETFTSLKKHFQKFGMELKLDSKNKKLFLLYPPGKPSEQEPAKYLLAEVPQAINLRGLAKLSLLARRLRKELLVPAGKNEFIELRLIREWK